MTSAEQKERAVRFIKAFEKLDSRIFDEMVTEDFVFEAMTRRKGLEPIRGREAAAKAMPATLNAAFPNGLNLKFHTVIAEGPHVAIQAESDTIVANGKHYNNRYHFYVRFEGDRIAQVREYNDTEHVREVFFS